jgi:hypothetical protein
MFPLPGPYCVTNEQVRVLVTSLPAGFAVAALLFPPDEMERW